MSFAPIFLALALAACSSPSAARVEARIDRAGGEVSLADGVARGAGIVVPPGAVDAETTFTITTGEPDGVAAGFVAVGPMVTFGPEGALFATPVRITVPARSEPMVLLTRPHGTTDWARVDGAVWSAETGLVSAEVMHFSDFLPIDRDPETVSDGGVAPPPGDGGSVPPPGDAGDFCITHPRDPRCVVPPMPMPGCDAVAQDCAAGQMCVASDQESGYDWGDGRDALCIPAGTLPAGSPCVAPSDCARGTQCVFQTMYDSGEGLIWFSQETDYLPMWESFCRPVCAHGGPACATAGEICHPVQLWGFSGRDVNEAVGVCHAPPPDGPPRP
ncbi:MAG: hypothetical protein M3Y87_29735 [Myxococcota bacterium]|nr:hypothetical protein [Myxococcota bacterium]